MRILFLSDDFPPMSFGGAGISTYELARGMKKAGHEVFVITTCRKSQDVGVIEYGGLRVHRIQSNYPLALRAWVSLCNVSALYKVREIMKEIKPDVVHVNNVHQYLSYGCLLLVQMYTKAVVFTARDVMLFNFSKLNTLRYLQNLDSKTYWFDHLRQAKLKWNPFRNLCARILLKSGVRVFSVSDALRIALSKHKITPVTVVHTGVDISEYTVLESERLQLSDTYNLRNKKVLMFSGRLSDAKGSRVLTLAFARILERVPNAVLLVVGSSETYMHAMQKDVFSKSLRENVVCTGWIDRESIRKIYALADVVCVPSICFDAFPRVVVEAMAAGKPVIGTRYGGAPEIIQDGVTGYVVDPFSVNEMSERAIELLTDTDKAVRFGESAKRRVETNFNLDEKVREYLTAYESLLRNT